jgi:hypothetical protein
MTSIRAAKTQISPPEKVHFGILRLARYLIKFFQTLLYSENNKLLFGITRNCDAKARNLLFTFMQSVVKLTAVIPTNHATFRAFGC